MTINEREKSKIIIGQSDISPIWNQVYWKLRIHCSFILLFFFFKIVYYIIQYQCNYNILFFKFGIQDPRSTWYTNRTNTFVYKSNQINFHHEKIWFLSILSSKLYSMVIQNFLSVSYMLRCDPDHWQTLYIWPIQVVVILIYKSNEIFSIFYFFWWIL